MHDVTHRQDGFHVVMLLVVVIILSIIGIVGYTTLRHTATPQNGPVRWAFDQTENKWSVPDGTAPACKEPLIFDTSPVDINQVTSVMLPGAYRGYSYKPHGGFRLDNIAGGKIDIKIPIDAKLVGLTRYYEGNPPELQYLLTFETDCGIAFRFDHLHTLTPKFQTFAEKTPPPKKDDTRSSPGDQPDPIAVKAGEIVATAVGFPQVNNFGFDFGVYDYRQRNEISKNTAWASIHRQYVSMDWFGVCWFDMLPGSDAAKARTLSEVQVDTRKQTLIVSDYCSNAPYKTLDINNGQPTGG